MTQRLRVTIEAEMPDYVRQEDIAERFGKMLASAGLTAASTGDEYATPQVPIKTIGPRGRSAAFAPGTGTGGYETRIWEKVTCDFAAVDPTRMDDVIINPRINVEVVNVQAEAAGGAGVRQTRA